MINIDQIRWEGQEDTPISVNTVSLTPEDQDIVWDRLQSETLRLSEFRMLTLEQVDLKDATT
jgi:hypothetical protein